MSKRKSYLLILYQNNVVVDLVDLRRGLESFGWQSYLVYLEGEE